MQSRKPQTGISFTHSKITKKKKKKKKSVESIENRTILPGIYDFTGILL
jgi:hypothetical protein